MRKAIKQGIATFVLVWAFVHAFYAFVMLDWSPFTEWEPLTRGAILFASLGFGLTPILIQVIEDHFDD